MPRRSLEIPNDYEHAPLQCTYRGWLGWLTSYSARGYSDGENWYLIICNHKGRDIWLGLFCGIEPGSMIWGVRQYFATADGWKTSYELSEEEHHTLKTENRSSLPGTATYIIDVCEEMIKRKKREIENQ